MTRRFAAPLFIVFAIAIAAPATGSAQTFKVEKYDIKGDGGTDYISVESATGHVFVSRQNHVMVV